MAITRITRSARSWIYRNASLLLLLAPLFSLVALEAWARAGGGGNYSSGSRSSSSRSSGGSGGGGGALEELIIRLLFELVIRYPAVGVPVVIGVCVFIYYSQREGQEIYVDYTIRKGMKAQKENNRLEALNSLKKRDPQFSEDVFLARIERAFLKVQKSWCDHNLALAQAFMSDGVYERFGLQIQEQKDKGIRDRMENIQVLERQVAQIQSDTHFDTIHVYIRASAIDHEVDLKTGKAVKSSQGDEEFEEYWSFLRKPGAKSLSAKGGLIEGTCPNCGAPLEVNSTVKCNYCQAFLRSGEYDWVLAEITQGCEWAIQEGRQIPGVRKLVERDAGFNLQHLEDRASVVFWRFTTANRLGTITPLRKMCCDTCAEKLTTEVGFESRGVRRFYGDCAVGSVDVRGIALADDFDRAFVEIRWSGKPLEIKKGEKQPRSLGSVMNFHHGFILRRKPSVKSEVRNSLISSHCPNCGGPEGTTDAVACEYCGTVVNDGSYDWVLEQMVPVGSPEFRDALQELRRQQSGSGRPAKPGVVGVAPGSPGSQPGPVAGQGGLGSFVELPGLEVGSLAAAAAGVTGTDLDGSEASAGSLEALGLGALDCVRWVAQMMLADGVIEDKERDYLKEFAAKCGVSEAKLQGIIGSISVGGDDLPVPENRHEARNLLKAIAGMALADGRLSPEETAVLNQFGGRVGLSPLDVNMLVKQERQRLFQLAQQIVRSQRKV